MRKRLVCQHRSYAQITQKFSGGYFTIKFCDNCDTVIVSTTYEETMSRERFQEEWNKIKKDRKKEWSPSRPPAPKSQEEACPIGKRVEQKTKQ